MGDKPERNSLALRLPVGFGFFFLRTHLDAECEQLRVQKAVHEVEEAEGALQQPSPDTPTNANTRGIIFTACSGASTLSTVADCVICRVQPLNSSVHRQAGPPTSHHAPNSGEQPEWAVTAF